MVSVPLPEGNNWDFARGSPTEIFCFFGQWDRVSTRQAGVWIDFHFSGFYFYSVRVFSPNPISIIRIVQYFTISVLGDFKDTLANVRIPEALLKFDSNCVTWVENKYVRRESNQIGIKQLILIKSKPQLSLIK